MKKPMVLKVISLFFICLSVYGCSLFYSHPAYEWQEVVSAEGKFRASFPASPKADTKEINLPSGEKMQVYQLTVAWPALSFVVMTNDLSNEAPTSEEELNRRYDRMRDGTVSDLSAKLVSERKVIVEGHLGREVITNRNNLTTITRNFLIGKTLYQVMSTQRDSERSDRETLEAVNRFLDSFRPTN